MAIKADLEPLSGEWVFGFERLRKDLVELSKGLSQGGHLDVRNGSHLASKNGVVWFNQILTSAFEN